MYEPERLRSLIAYFGEAVRRAVGGEWSFGQDPRGVRVDVAAPLGQRLDFISDAYGLIDEGEHPNWVSLFDEATQA